MAINQQISALPQPPSSADPANFDVRADAFLGGLAAFQTQLNTFASEANATADMVDADALSASASANTASTAAVVATGAANYQGEYVSSKTYQVGQSVSYLGKVYVAKTVNTGVTPVDGANWLEVKSGGFPIGGFAYWDKDAATPEGHLTFVDKVVVNRGVYPDLDVVIPATPPAFGLLNPTHIANPAPATNDQFGYSVAISGDYAIVGAYLDDPGGVGNAGSAYIYFRSGTTWSLQATLPNPQPAASDHFGFSVAISGDYAIVGAYLDDPGGVVDAGSAYIYFRSGTTWSLQATLPNPDPQSSDQFGYSVAISGDYAIVGAYADDPGGVSNAGSAYIYFRSGTTWSLQATLPNPQPADSDFFGYSVAISGDYAIVGAYQDDPGGVSNAGSAYIYFRSGTTWSLQATLPNPDPQSSDFFGYSVAISGDYAIVGAYLDDPGGVGDAGSAYIYFRTGTTWSLQATLPNPAPAANDNFGWSVAISGDYAIVGANADDPGGVSNAGSAYIYFRTGTTWSLQATLPNPDPAASDEFGYSVAISGDYAIVGARFDDPGGVGNAGSAYIYFRGDQPVSVLHPLPASAEHKTIVRVE